MQSLSGRVAKFLPDPSEGLSALRLDGGREIHFLCEYRERVNSIARIGAKIEIKGFLIADSQAGGTVGAVRITCLDSRESIDMDFPDPRSPLEILARPLAAKSASATKAEDHEKKRTEARPVLNAVVEEKPTKTAGFSLGTQSSPAYLRELLLEHAGRLPESMRMEAASAVGHAYDLLHRVQAILAYLHIMKRRVPGISQFLDESQRTYGQALSQFGNGDYSGAIELAAASGQLSKLVEMIIARTLRGDTSFPTLLAPPPKHLGGDTDSSHVEEKLAQVECILSRVHWLLENGTLPLEDRTQVRKIAAWGDALYKQAQHTYRSSELEDAEELVQASLAGAYSAEHVCRRWYLGHPTPPGLAAHG